MRPHFLLLAALTACFDEPAEAPAADAAVAAKAKAKAKAKAAAKAKAEAEAKAEAAAARGAFGSDPAQALADLEAQLRDAPEDPAVWIKLEGAALAAGDAAGLFERLGTDPVGGQSARHHVLRATLALAAGNAGAALQAAQEAQADAPDDAAALIAASILAGAEMPEEDGEPGPALELARWAQAPSERAARRNAEAALAVAGWRAAQLRAVVLAARGDEASALAELEGSASETDPRAGVRANLARAAMGLSPNTSISASEAASWAGMAAAAAGDAGLVTEALAAGGLVAQLSLRAVDPDAGAAVLSSLAERFDAQAPGAAAANSLLAQVSLAAGNPGTARIAAKAALAVEGAADEDKQRGAWSLAWASWDLASAEDARAAADALQGAQAQIADAMALYLSGEVAGAAAQLSFGDLSDRDQAYSRRAAARIDSANALEHREAAVAAADRSRDPVLQVQTRLDLEATARGLRHPAARSARSQLARLVPDGDAGKGLAAELAARAMLSGDSASGAVDAWAALGKRVSAEESGAATAGVAAWAKARAALLNGEDAATERLQVALARLPTHRHGLLSAGTALDGSGGVDIGIEMAALTGTTELNAAYQALLVQEAEHRATAGFADAQHGRRIDQEVDRTLAEELLGAAARARAQMVRYHAGVAGLPHDAFAALLEAEKKVAGASPAVAKSFPQEAVSLSDLRRALDGAATLSLNLGPDKAYGVVLTSRTGAVRDLGQAATLTRLAEQHQAALLSAVGKADRASHTAGDGLRSVVLDPFMQDLSGFGRYLVIAPGDVFSFPFTTFPEQSDGLRWLADIRTMANTPDLRRLVVETLDDEVVFSPDFLGFGDPEAVVDAGETTGSPAGEGTAEQEDEAPGGTTNEDLMRRYRQNADMPTDLGSAAEQFGEDFRRILLRTDATAAAYKETASRARYIHISSVDAAGDGGFVLADGTLSIADLRTQPLQAELVIVTASAPAAVQQHRARAFLDAGAESVIVASWDVSPQVLDRLFDGFYEAINRDRPPASAIREARESLMRTSLNEREQDDPADWGPLLLFSTP